MSFTPAIAWDTIMPAIKAWVVAASGLNADHVVWGQQNAPRFADTFVVLRILTVDHLGEGDYVTTEANPSPSPGAEIIRRALGTARVTMTMTCFAPVIGAAGAVSLIETVLASDNLPSVCDALSAAGVSIVNWDGVQSTDAVINSAKFEPRAVVTIRFFCVSIVSETGTNIDTVNVGDEITSTIITVSGT